MKIPLVESADFHNLIAHHKTRLRVFMQAEKPDF